MISKKLRAQTKSSLYLKALVQLVMVAVFAGVSVAATPVPVTCDPGTGIWDFGLEWIAKTCVPKTMTDSTVTEYNNNYVTCNKASKSVELFASFGDDTMTPEDFISYAVGLTASNGKPYKIFRNSQGTHFLLVHPGYTGLIDGKDMTGYAEGQVYTDVFTKGFVLPPTPLCKKAPPCNHCPCTEVRAASTVNIISGRLSHDQELFSTKGGQSPLAVSLNYRSIPFAPSSIGMGWAHSYETSLQAGGSSTVTIWDNGTVRDYRLLAGAYQSAPGDFSILTKTSAGAYVLTEKNGLVQNFDSAGRIISKVDTNGNTTSFSYTGGKLSSVTDPNGRVANFLYDTNGNLSSIAAPMGMSYSFSYTSGTLTRVTHPDGGTWDYTYAGSGMLETKTDQVGNTSSYSYDADNRVISATDPQGQTRSYGFGGSPAPAEGKVPDPYPHCTNQVGFDPDNKLKITEIGDCENVSLSVTEKNSGGWQYGYEYTSETLKSVTDPYNNTTSYTHDENGNVLTKTEPGVGTTWYSYDARGNTTSIKDPLGNSTTYTYNALGQVLTTSGPQGSTSNSYDDKGNLTSSTDAAGTTTLYENDGRGNLTKTTNAKGQVTLMTYTAAGQLATLTDPAGIVTGYSYDSAGNMISSTAPGGTTTYAYDSMNRLTGITDPLGHITSNSYDKQGNRVSQTDANGNTTSYEFTYQGQISAIKDALNNKTGFSYGTSSCSSCASGVDKLTALTDAKQQTTNYNYDLVSRLAKETDPLGKATNYTYDDAGNLATKTDANGITVRYSYDALKRLTAKVYPDNSGETYSYDAAGRLATAANKDIKYTYSYDAGGRLISVADARGYAVAYENDTLGSRTKTTLQPGTADQHITSYSYDTANRPKTITTAAGAFTYNYDALGRRSSAAYPNGISTSYQYDALGRLTRISHSAGATGIAFANYSSFDKVGNRQSKVSDGGSESYNYDPVYRLTQAATPRGTENYSYDAVGNRLSGPGPKDTKYQYNAGNQMIFGRILGYLYDNNGNQTSRGGSAPEKSWNGTWDYENRLVRMEKDKGAEKHTVSFKYDPQGRRIEKKLTTTIGAATKISSWTYVYDNDNIALEIYTDPAGAVTKTFYTHGPGVDEHLSLERNGNTYYYHTDGLGSTIAISDGSKNIVQTYGYDSFGAVRASTDFVNTYTYTGREWDKETGLYYYRARYYDPMQGRFISKDPIGFAGGDLNLYGYVKNNPLNFTDPKGEWGLAAAGVGAAVGYVWVFKICMEKCTGTKLPRDPNVCPAPSHRTTAQCFKYCFNLANMLGSIGLGEGISNSISTPIADQYGL
jgi:RHS repeat-associated protein